MSSLAKLTSFAGGYPCSGIGKLSASFKCSVVVAARGCVGGLHILRCLCTMTTHPDASARGAEHMP